MPSRFLSGQTVLIRGFAVLSLFAISCVFAASVQAQTAARTGATGNAAAGTAAANGEIAGGNAIDPASLFSSTTSDSGTNFGQLGANSGRFAASAVQNAPTAADGTTQNQQGRSTNRAFQQFNQGGGNRNFLQQFNRQFGNQNRSTSRFVRPSLRLGFALPARPNTDIQDAATSRVATVASRVTSIADTQPVFQGIEVAAVDGVVTLTGTVPDEAAARLAANILRMEAGVRSVKNELTVAAPVTAP